MFLAYPVCVLFFFFNDTATTEIYTLSLHDALPILPPRTNRETQRSVMRPLDLRHTSCPCARTRRRRIDLGPLCSVVDRSVAAPYRERNGWQPAQVGAVGSCFVLSV